MDCWLSKNTDNNDANGRTLVRFKTNRGENMVTLMLTATLKDIDGNPLADKPINFYYSYDSQTWNLIETKNTNENGQATTTFTTYQTTYFKAEFPGDENYDPSSDIEVYTVEIPAVEETIRQFVQSLVNTFVQIFQQILPLIIMFLVLFLVISLVAKIGEEKE